MTKTIVKMLTIAAALSLGGCLDYSEGDRVGTVIKLSKKGIFCKTWEGEMLLGGLKKKTSIDDKGVSSTNMVANTWQFTIEDQSHIPALMKALDTQQPIRISYKQELITFCRSDSEGNYFVTGVTQ